MNLQTDYGIPIQTNVPLCRFSTFQIGGAARYFAEPIDREQLPVLLDFYKQEEIPLFKIGRGSNVLFADEGFPGLVISFRKFELERTHFGSNDTVKVPAGLSLFRLSNLCLERGYSGLEFICHIPGTVGGAVIMNAGFGRQGVAYREIKDVLISVTVLDPDGKMRVLSRNEIEFCYRFSNLNHMIILDATFKVKKSTPDEVGKEVKANFAYRNSVQDLRYPSAGSVFKNPRNGLPSSGKMIDAVGLKGTRVGGAMISERHGNFILNVGGAKATDVLTLIELAKSRVRDKFGVDLETEVKIVVPGVSFCSEEVRV